MNKILPLFTGKCLLFLLPILISARVQCQNYAENSVLAEGEWVKIGVLKSGVYKLDFSYFKKNGLLRGAVDPRNIRIYGNGGGMLPQSNNIPRPDDLLENCIYVKGEEDGSFDKNDFVLFYASGPHEVTYDIASKKIGVVHNVYTDTAYYFITTGFSGGKRINTDSFQDEGQEISTFTEYYHHEKDLVNVLSTDVIGAPGEGSGREWYGESFDSEPKNFSLDLSGITPNSVITLSSSVLNSSYSSNTFTVKLDNQEIGKHFVGNAIEGTYNLKGIPSQQTFSQQISSFSNSADVLLQYTFDKNSNSKAIGYLNFFCINYEKQLRLYGNQTIFRSFESLNFPAVKYKIPHSGENTFIWDISAPAAPVLKEYNDSGDYLTVSASSEILREFVVFDASKVPAPITGGRISNQNLHAISGPEFLIITHPLFYSEGIRLKNFRQEKNNIPTEVIDVKEIYNEFSSGRQDVTAIRDFIRMVYLKGGKKLKYVLLLGDCSYDYKRQKIAYAGGTAENTNFIPVYESRESLHPIRSYSSDDYYGFMDDNEGEWLEESKGDHTLEIGIGRIPCKNHREAKIAVDKIIGYSENKNTYGNWRTNITFVADDGDFNTHLKDAERLTTKIDTSYKSFNTRKIYLDAFPQSSEGATSTQKISIPTRKAIDEAFKKGSLIVNYTGHGGISGWADEKILITSQISELNNKEKLPLLITATCAFGKYDDPVVSSAGEQILLNPKGGAIALITTTRPVFSSTNYILNKAFYEIILKKVNADWPTLGEALVYTKNESLNGTINRNFALLGDPSMKLALPQNEAVLLSINGKDMGTDSLKALKKVSLSGEIRDKEGNSIEDFDGVLNYTLFDKATTLSTLGEENPVAQFRTNETVIARGKCTVSKGKFTFNFTVPRNINYQSGQSRISLYAYDSERGTDAIGSSDRIILGGSEAEFPVDTIPPEITLFLNDSTFKSEDKVSASPILIASLSDESGINITHNAAGQDLKATLSSSTGSEIIILNDYFEYDLNTHTKGKLIFPIQQLQPGEYDLLLSAWDINNNPAEASIKFQVVNNKGTRITNLLNFPNPLNYSSGTTFSFDHDRREEDFEIVIQVFSVEGKLIKEIKDVIYKSENTISGIFWNGRDSLGNNIPNGVYVYKLMLRSMSDKNLSYGHSRLVIMN